MNSKLIMKEIIKKMKINSTKYERIIKIMNCGVEHERVINN